MAPRRSSCPWRIPVFIAACAAVPGVLLVAEDSLSSSQAAGVEDVRQFVAGAEETLNRLGVRSSRADWVQSTFITTDTQAIAAEAREAQITAATQLAKQAARFRDVKLPPDLARKLTLLRLQLTMPAPADPGELAELTRIATSLAGDYGKRTYCRQAKAGKQECLDVTAIDRMMAESRDPRELGDLWSGWHRIGPPMRARYARFVELSNKGARELGFEDTGAMWRSNYDMPADRFSTEVERLCAQVRPCYVSLHAYVRRRLAERYGASVVSATGPIPAHLLGNPWAQEWGNIYDRVAPVGETRAIDLTERLRARNMDARAMVRAGEGFFTSLGFASVNLLGPLTLHEARRSERRLSRERLGRRRPRRRAPEDVHTGERGRLQHRSPRAWPRSRAAQTSWPALSAVGPYIGGSGTSHSRR